MSNDNKEQSSDSSTHEKLAHEKKISEIYQSDKIEQAQLPSSQLDSIIMALAKQQLANHPNLLAKEPTHNSTPAVNKHTKRKFKKAWQWPVSLAASVGILGVLFMTQRDYFIQPNNIVASDVGMLNESVMRGPFQNAAEPQSDEIVAAQSFQVMTNKATTQKSKIQLDNNYDIARKSEAESQSSILLERHISDRLMQQEKLTKTSSITLSEMTKLAELIKLEMNKHDLTDLAAKTSIEQMQQTLFQHLLQFQKNERKFVITDNFLAVLTDKQVQQLTSFNMNDELHN